MVVLVVVLVVVVVVVVVAVVVVVGEVVVVDVVVEVVGFTNNDVVLPSVFGLLQHKWLELRRSQLTWSQNLGRLLAGALVAKFLNFSVSKLGLFEEVSKRWILFELLRICSSLLEFCSVNSLLDNKGLLVVVGWVTFTLWI